MTASFGEALDLLRDMVRRFSPPIPDKTLEHWAGDLVDVDYQILKQVCEDLPKRVNRPNFRLLWEHIDKERASAEPGINSDIPSPEEMRRHKAEPAWRYACAARVLQCAIQSRMRDPVTGEPYHPARYDAGVEDDPDVISAFFQKCLSQNDETLQKWSDKADRMILAMKEETAKRHKTEWIARRNSQPAPQEPEVVTGEV